MHIFIVWFPVLAGIEFIPVQTGYGTRLESKVFSLEIFDPSSPVVVSKSQTNNVSKKILDPKN